MTMQDLPWLQYLCMKKYSGEYDSDLTTQWFAEIVLRNPLMFVAVRTDNAFSIAFMNTFPWLPADPEVNVSFVCADTDAMWEAMKCLRATINWAKRRNAKWWNLASDTDADLQLMAKRLGANEIMPRYRLALR